MTEEKQCNLQYEKFYSDAITIGNEKEHYVGKIRIFVHKTIDVDLGEQIEVLGDKEEFFEDSLISDVNETECKGLLGHEIENGGYGAFQKDIIKEIDKYITEEEDDPTIELLADAYIQWYRCGGYEDPEECDCNCWLDNIKSRKLNKYQIERFCNDDYVKGDKIQWLKI